ncbi:glycosyltransferase family 2 protein [Novipirellula galeiformis]|uniref:glycosyltransferase family 2 protein n=1 Tax=Novipirellula galeiformis TaxID=2528004 RepID=UPI0018CDCCFA|nr:glycosyltransferase family 2 protein [Novipirellula galeiformis]
MPKPIAIIIPTSKPLDQLQRTLSSLQRTVTDSAEILIIQNGPLSDSHTARSLTDQFASLKIRCLHEATPGLLSGRHRGVQESTSEIISFIDDDIEVGPRWAEAIFQNFNNPDVKLVGGPSTAEYACSVPEWLDAFFHRSPNEQWCTYLSLLELGDQRTEMPPNLIWGLNFSIRRSALLELGGFHPDGVPWNLRRFRGDGESAVTEAARRCNMTAIYDPNVAVTHLIPKTRLTPNYFQRRAHLQGISDSYTQLRNTHLHGAPPTSPPEKNSIRERLSFVVKQQIGLSKNPMNKAIFQTQKAYREGYLYHQRQFQIERVIREWVLRPDYWDYSYPLESKSNETA